MRLTLAVTAPLDADPQADEVRHAAHEAAARSAVTWTEPVYVSAEQRDGYQLVRYVTDAVPKTGVVTTASIAPALLPPHVA